MLLLLRLPVGAGDDVTALEAAVQHVGVLLLLRSRRPTDRSAPGRSFRRRWCRG